MAYRDPKNYAPILYFIMVSSNDSGFITSFDHEVMHLDATYGIPYIIIDTDQIASCPLFHSYKLDMVCSCWSTETNVCKYLDDIV